MARTKKHFNIMDENATKSKTICFRITPKELLELNKAKFRTGFSTSELYRNAMKDYVKKLFSE